MEISSNTLMFIGIGSVILGIIVGLFLFFYGRRKGKQTLGLVGLLVAIITGLIGPILPLLVLLVFVFLIARKAPLDSVAAEPGRGPADDDGSDSVI